MKTWTCTECWCVNPVYEVTLYPSGKTTEFRAACPTCERWRKDAEARRKAAASLEANRE